MPPPTARYWTDLLGAHQHAEGAVNAVESRVELMVRACNGAKVPLPGVDEAPELRHAITPTGAAVIRYLTHRLPSAGELTRRVQVAIFRFLDARSAVKLAATVLALRQVRAGLPEALRGKAYYLAHFGETFADEQVLSQLFPRAKPTPTRPTAPPPPARPAAPPAPDLEAQRAQARRLLESLAPWVALLAPLLRGQQLGGLLDPATRHTRTLRLGLHLSSDARELAGALVAAHEALAALIERGNDPAAWKEGAFQLSERAAALQAHPLLRDVPALAGKAP